jgi:NAD(P)H-dependent flavin oxidoreductase YrpB (nitropropane dioxygenase family)
MSRKATSTRFTALVGCRLPVQLAAMGGVGTTALAASVIDAGGLGMVPNGTEPAGGACGTNFLMPFVPSLEDIGAAATRNRVVEFFYGDPRRDVVSIAHEHGALVGWQVGSAREATVAEQAGCDYVVAQGVEAGGHVRGRQPLDELLAAILVDVRVPVVAAGGIATAQRCADVLRLGADAVRVGTRFVASPESAAHPEYVQKLCDARSGETVLTEWFGGGWEHAPHRVLVSALDAAQTTGWRSAMPPCRGLDRDVSDMALYAGVGVGDVNAREPGADVVADLMSLL